MFRQDSSCRSRRVHSQDSCLSVNDLRLHFGLGRAAPADLLRAQWPNSKLEEIRGVDADRLIRIEEGSGVVRTERFEDTGA